MVRTKPLHGVPKLQLIGVAALLILAGTVGAQTGNPAASGGSDPPPLKPEEFEQLAAPIALYPDSLVSQILMAATYPLEVVQAERWAKLNKDLKGDTLTTALEKESWDPSVKSLVNFPQVLSMMSEKLDWTTQLGDAFLAQPKELMAAVQKLRSRAKAEGNLETTKEQTVIIKEEAKTEVIVIESSNPEVVYVPTYNPTVVYGSWPYPSYPPYYYYPPGYVAAGAAISFGVGFACGAAWGYAWGGCNWGHGDVDIDIDRNNFVNNKIDRSRYKNEIGSRNRNMQNGRGSWQHDPSHRKGASYRDSNAAQKYGGASTKDAAKTRDAYRGRAEAGRQDISRGGADQFKGDRPSGGATRDSGNRAGATDRQGAANRQGSGARNQPSTTNRSGSSASNRSGALDGAGQSGRDARSASQRGQSSRSSSGSGASNRSSGSRGGGSSASRGGGGGGSRGGGGGARGGGGGGRGGGGRGPGYVQELF